MERFVQLFDDLDDLVSAIGLAGERLRALAVFACLTAAWAILQAGGILLAIRHPPLALGAAVLMFTVLLYRVVTSAHGRPATR